MCKVSVIMGVYQPKKQLLIKSVQSILRQSFQDFELIIVCDGSKETLPMLKELEKKDERIKTLYYEQNKGLAYALNCALENAEGEFIARQDDDDISFNSRLEKQLGYLSEHENIHFVCSNAEVYDDGGVYGTAEMPQQPKKQDFLYTCPFLHPTMLIRKQALLAVKGYRCAWYTKKAEDYDLYMRLFARGFVGVNLQERLYLYRFERNGKRKRKLVDRLGEAWVRAKGFCEMKMGIKGFFYTFKPLAAWLVPRRFFEKKRKYIK